MDEVDNCKEDMVIYECFALCTIDFVIKGLCCSESRCSSRLASSSNVLLQQISEQNLRVLMLLSKHGHFDLLLMTVFTCSTKW